MQFVVSAANTIKEGGLTWRLGLDYFRTSGGERPLKVMTFELKFDW